MKSPGPLLVCRCVVSVWGVLFAPALFGLLMARLNYAELATYSALIMFCIVANFGGFVLCMLGKMCAV